MIKVDYINSAHSQIVTIILGRGSNKIQHIVICINHAKNIFAPKNVILTHVFYKYLTQNSL
jgi:hypothetical protein